MAKKRNEQLLAHARVLRKNMTREESHLWYDFLRGYSVRFRRQEIIGNFIADFYCSRAGLIVELDGSQHYHREGVDYDLRRTTYLESIGLSVLRFSNLDVHRNFEGVCMAIVKVVEERISQQNHTQKN